LSMCGIRARKFARPPTGAAGRVPKEDFSAMFTKAASIRIVAGRGKGARNRSTAGTLPVCPFRRPGRAISASLPGLTP
jgi:hypothetical protein